MTDSPAMSRVREARAGLLLTHPFFGVLSLKLQLVESRLILTAGVNTTSLIFNPDFVMLQSNAELKGLIAHEVLHLAFCHHARQGNRDAKKWNVAGDYIINDALREEQFVLPKGGLLSDKYKHATWTTEAVYNDLPDSEIEKLFGQGEAATGTFDPAGAGGSAEAGDAEREWMQNAADAMRVAQSAGKMPAGLKRLVQEVIAPRQDWKSLVTRFFRDQERWRQTWSRPNRRYAPSGLYLPGTQRAPSGTVAFGIDTSGSIDDKTLAEFGSHCRACIEDCEPERVYVIYCDAAVAHVDVFEDPSEFKLNPHGGGGTDFRPVFERIAAEGWQVSCALYLTDLMGTFPDRAPEFPVLWCAHGAGGAVAPWGETVVVD